MPDPPTKESVYAKADELQAYLRAARLGELVNDDGSKDVTTDAAKLKLNEQLWRTERVVHGFIGAPKADGSAYLVPQIETRSPRTFAALGEIILAITAHRLFTRGLVAGKSSDDLKLAAEKSWAQVEGVQAGTRSLPADAARATALPTSGARSGFLGGSEAPIFGEPDE